MGHTGGRRGGRPPSCLGPDDALRPDRRDGNGIVGREGPSPHLRTRADWPHLAGRTGVVARCSFRARVIPEPCSWRQSNEPVHQSNEGPDPSRSGLATIEAAARRCWAAFGLALAKAWHERNLRDCDQQANKRLDSAGVISRRCAKTKATDTGCCHRLHGRGASCDRRSGALYVRAVATREIYSSAAVTARRIHWRRPPRHHRRYKTSSGVRKGRRTILRWSTDTDRKKRWLAHAAKSAPSG